MPSKTLEAGLNPRNDAARYMLTNNDENNVPIVYIPSVEHAFQAQNARKLADQRRNSPVYSVARRSRRTAYPLNKGYRIHKQRNH